MEKIQEIGIYLIRVLTIEVLAKELNLDIERLKEQLLYNQFDELTKTKIYNIYEQLNRETNIQEEIEGDMQIKIEKANMGIIGNDLFQNENENPKPKHVTFEIQEQYIKQLEKIIHKMNNYNEHLENDIKILSSEIKSLKKKVKKQKKNKKSNGG